MSDDAALPALLDQVAVVLFEPQDDINIGSVARACKNFGVSTLRLVNPARADLERIAISATHCADLIARIERFDTLDEALADRVLTFGTSARSRREKRLYLEPRGAAADLAAAAHHSPVALLFGREDSGLPNEALDRCQGVITIPTSPHHASLNLAQASLLMLWELFRVATDAPIARAPEHLVLPSSEHPIASQLELETLLARVDVLLRRVDFLKEGVHDAHMLNSLRAILQRAGLDQREVAIAHGITSQINWGLENPERLKPQ